MFSVPPSFCSPRLIAQHGVVLVLSAEGWGVSEGIN